MINESPRIETLSPRSKLIIISALAALLMFAAGSQPFANASEEWGYTGRTGPLYWGTELMPGEDDAYEVCLDGVTQSPISGTSLNTREILAPAPIQPKDATGKVINNGHAIAVGSLDPGEELKTDSQISFNGTIYRLKQVHFHCPSEHRRSATAAFDPMEIHLVHKSDSGSLAVIAVFITAGNGNAVLQQVLTNLTTGTPITFNVSGLLPQANVGLGLTAWIYYGSLTTPTPTCTEGVKWFVMKQPITATTDQINEFKKAYSNNSRGASFEKVDGGLKQISSGENGVWGVNSSKYVYVRQGITDDNLRGTGWGKLWPNFIHVSSGRTGVWLVSDKYQVSYASNNGGTPELIPNQQPNIYRISAGKYGVWAVNTSHQVFYRTGVTGSKPMGDGWKQLTTAFKFKDISSGEFGVWAVEDLKNNLYFLQDSLTGSLENPIGSIFSPVTGGTNISRISSGVLGVWALEAGSGGSQVIKSRSGITTENPAGSGWRVQDGFLNEISNGKDGVWGNTNANDKITNPYYIYFLSSPPTK
jgi:carbonic anhydrase